MRDVVQELLHGITGQTLVMDAPEGRPSSVTSVTVVENNQDDDGTVESATTGSASVESNPSTTLAAAAGVSQADPTALTLTSATGVSLGRSYLLSSAAGHNEWVELVSLNGTSAVVRQPLINDYAITTSTFQTTRMSISVSSTWIADVLKLSDESCVEPRYRAIWVYVVGGVTYRRQAGFDVVRYSAQHHVTPLDVDLRFPGWLDRLPTDYRKEQGKSVIGQAWRAIKMDLRADGKLGRWVRNSDVVSELVLCRSNLISVELAAMHGSVTAEQLVSAQNIYRQRYDQLVREPHTTLAVTEMGAVRPASREPLFRR